jgi:hypothetical protein
MTRAQLAPLSVSQLAATVAAWAWSLAGLWAVWWGGRRGVGGASGEGLRGLGVVVGWVVGWIAGMAVGTAVSVGMTVATAVSVAVGAVVGVVTSLL